MPNERRKVDVDTRKAIADIRRDVKCLHDSFMAYEPYLKKVMETHQFWGRFREQVITGTAKSVIATVIVGFVTGVGLAIREILLRWGIK